MLLLTFNYFIEMAIKGVKLISDPKVLKMDRYHQYSKYAVVNSNFGGTMADLDGKIELMKKYIEANKQDECFNEMNNLRNLLYLTINALPSTISYVIAPCVVEIDGDKIYDYSDTGIDEIVRRIEKRATFQELKDTEFDLKKKYLTN